MRTLSTCGANGTSFRFFSLSSPTRLMAPPNRHEAPDSIWQQTYLSAVLRAILYSDDLTFFLEAYRRLEPIAAPDAELCFLQAAEALFMKGADFSPIVLRPA